jgi:molybdopterin adenylyltransferase
MDDLRIGLVSISDRASAGVYEDKGLPGLKEWFAAALKSPWSMEPRLIPDEQPVIERTLVELLDPPAPSRADDRRHRPRAATPLDATLAVAHKVMPLRRRDAAGQPRTYPPRSCRVRSCVAVR